MKIAEVFYSIQGEGFLVGMPSVFIRTSGCNLRCRWCDSPYTSWAPEGEEMALDAILEAVAGYPSRYVVITGGEPLIARDIVALTEAFKTRDYHVTVETAATVDKPIVCDLASLSPKLSNSTPWHEEGGKYAERHERLRMNVKVIQAFIGRYPYQLKCVIDTPDDVEEVERLLLRLRGVERERVMLMPQGVTTAELLGKARWLGEECKSRGFRFCPRVQIDLYGNTRGT
ncbi:MAG: 7-carboxy-7-deazaguanine synthase QueE [Candidatus Latescibacteria bacterium]|nr:7-carboxy-7-deazaguanine synthase QueE [Candidatus Latescibacterota bacterium]